MSERKLIYLILLTCLTVSTVFILGCASDENEKDVQDDPKESVEAGDWLVNKGVIDRDELEKLAVKEDWQVEEGSSSIVSIGENFLASYNLDKKRIDLISKDNLEVVDQIEEVEQGNREIDFLAKDHLLYRNIGNEESYIYQITHDGKELVEEINIYESGLSIPDDENDRLSQIASNIDFHINIDFGIVDDYLFVFPNYSGALEFEEPPRLKEPVLKVFQFGDGGLEKVEKELLEEPLLTTDVVEFKDDTALLSTACEGLIQIDLADFSLEKLNFGGNYNLAEENRPFSNGHYQDFYAGHFFRGISSEDVILMRTQTPLPKCHGWKKHLVVPNDDGSFSFVGQSGVYSKGQIDDENLGSTFPYKLKGDWLVAANSTQAEMEEFDGGGVFALLELDHEMALQSQDTYTSDLPGIGEYFDTRIDLKDVLSEAGFDRLPSIVSWKVEGEKKISSYYPGQSQTQEDGEEEPEVFSRVKEDSIELKQMPTEMQVLEVDGDSKEIYVELEGDLYRLDYDSI